MGERQRAVLTADTPLLLSEQRHTCHRKPGSYFASCKQNRNCKSMNVSNLSTGKSHHGGVRVTAIGRASLGSPAQQEHTGNTHCRCIKGKDGGDTGSEGGMCSGGNETGQEELAAEQRSSTRLGSRKHLLSSAKEENGYKMRQQAGPGSHCLNS